MTSSEDTELSRINARLSEIDAERHSLLRRRQAIERTRARRKFSCSCVHLNKTIDIHDMAEQHAAGRRGLQIGLVSETFSALENCISCRGTGIPKKRSTKKEARP